MLQCMKFLSIENNSKMKKQKRTLQDGRRIKSWVGSDEDNLRTRVRQNLSNLVETILYEKREYKGITIKATKTAEGWNYDIEYGERNPSLKDVSKLQEIVKKSAEEYIKQNNSKNGATLGITHTSYSLDPFGIKRLTKYLLGVKR